MTPDEVIQEDLGPDEASEYWRWRMCVPGSLDSWKVGITTHMGPGFLPDNPTLYQWHVIREAEGEIPAGSGDLKSEEDALNAAKYHILQQDRQRHGGPED